MEIFKKSKEVGKGAALKRGDWTMGNLVLLFFFCLDVDSPSFKCFKTLNVLFGIGCAEKWVRMKSM